LAHAKTSFRRRAIRGHKDHPVRFQTNQPDPGPPVDVCVVQSIKVCVTWVLIGPLFQRGFILPRIQAIPTKPSKRQLSVAFSLRMCVLLNRFSIGEINVRRSSGIGQGPQTETIFPSWLEQILNRVYHHPIVLCPESDTTPE